jgi:hypothetical protein
MGSLEIAFYLDCDVSLPNLLLGSNHGLGGGYH